jgi:hypothetical protein
MAEMDAFRRRRSVRLAMWASSLLTGGRRSGDR